VREVVLYGAPDCHLCEAAGEKLRRVQRLIPFQLTYNNIREDAALTERYGSVIPVVTVDGKETAMSKVTEFRLLKALALL